MLFKELPTTFHDFMKRIVYFNCFVGMGAYRKSNISDVAYFCMQVYTTIFILMNLTMTYFGLIPLVEDKHNRDMLVPAHNIFAILVHINSFLAVISPIFMRLQKKVLKDCVRQIPILDDTFHDILGVRIEYTKQYIRMTRQAIAIVLGIFFLGIYDTMMVLPKKVSLWFSLAVAVTLHYPIILILVLDLNFCTFVEHLQKRFRDLNDGLLVMAKKPSVSCRGRKLFVVSREASNGSLSCQIQDATLDNYVYLLHEIRKVHLELCKLSGKINQAFGVHNLLSMGFSFVLITGLSYTIYGAMVWESYYAIDRIEHSIPSVLWTLVYVSKILIVNHLCWSTRNEAERTGEVIYELLDPRSENQLQDEIKGFGIQMLQNPVLFNACGFFNLDYTFVQGVIGSITTYLIILIQMVRVNASPISNTVLAWNTTEVSAIEI